MAKLSSVMYSQSLYPVSRVPDEAYVRETVFAIQRYSSLPIIQPARLLFWRPDSFCGPTAWRSTTG